MKKIILFMIVSFIWSIQGYSQWTPDNTVIATWSLTSADEAHYLKVKGGFVYVTGNCFEFNGGNFLHAIMTIKYDANLNELWRAIYWSPNGQQNQVAVNGIDVGNDGNVYITGFIYNVSSNNDYLTIKYDQNGNLSTTWRDLGSGVGVRTYDGNVHGNDTANAIGVDNSGNVYVTGGSYEHHDPPRNTTNQDITTISYSSSGVQQWVKSFYHKPAPNVSDGDDEAFGIAIFDPPGPPPPGFHPGVYVAGWYDDGWNCGTQDPCLKDAQLVYYDFTGGGEDEVYYGCGGCSPVNYHLGNDFAKAVVVSPTTGDIFCTGAKWCGESLCGNDPSHPPCPWQECPPGIPGSYEVFTFRSFWNTTDGGNTYFLDLDHDYCDNARYDGPWDYGEDVGNSLVVDANDYVYATGYSQQSNGPSNYDYITLKYNNSGGLPQEHGVKRPWCLECNPTHGEDVGCPRADCHGLYNSGGTADDKSTSIAIDATGSNVFVTGFANYLSQHIVTIQYRSDGSRACLGEYFGPSISGLEDAGYSIAVDDQNPAHVYVAGVTERSSQFSNNSDFVVLKYTACTGMDNKPNTETQKLIGAPKNYSLSQNFPNPFNPSTTINYSLPKASYVSLKIYNTLGQIVMSIPVKYREAGYYSEDINASSLASGIYFYKIEAKDASNAANIFTDTKKMLVIK